jgi:hypothetical protein
VNGAIVITGGFDGKGGQTGRSFAQEVSIDYPTGIILLVVAGMRYASYVSAKGYDVIDSAEILAQKIAPKILAQLQIVQ